MISYPFCLFWFCFPKFLGRRGWNLRSQENSINKKRIDVNKESMDETVKDTQYGFLSSERETGDLDLDYGSKKEFLKHLAGGTYTLLNTRQAGCINNQTIQMMITEEPYIEPDPGTMPLSFPNEELRGKLKLLWTLDIVHWRGEVWRFY